jgi:hypothetical protein
VDTGRKPVWHIDCERISIVTRLNTEAKFFHEAEYPLALDHGLTTKILVLVYLQIIGQFELCFFEPNQV